MVGYAGNQETAVIKQWLQRVGRDWGGQNPCRGSLRSSVGNEMTVEEGDVGVTSSGCQADITLSTDSTSGRGALWEFSMGPRTVVNEKDVLQGEWKGRPKKSSQGGSLVLALSQHSNQHIGQSETGSMPGG